MSCSSRCRAAFFWALLLLSGSLSADILHMRDGRRIEGQIVEETALKVRIKTGFGVLEFKPAEIESIERKKSKLQEFEERWEAATNADNFFALGEWAQAKRMRKQAKRAMRRAVALDPQHKGANIALGLVEYRGEWMRPEVRDERMARDHEKQMRERGLVLYKQRWVTLAEAQQLEKGLVLHEGEWMTVEVAQQAQGLEEFDGGWIPRAEAVARQSARVVAQHAGEEFRLFIDHQALVAGPLKNSELKSIGAGLVLGRAWYAEIFGPAPGLELLGGRLAEFYVFPRGSGAYAASIEPLSKLTETLPEGWLPVARESLGFWWSDPFTLSSARQSHRSFDGLQGHCYHHWGHMLLNRRGYDGRLLPPWYDEGLASLVEFHTHGRNAVFCRAQTTLSTGTNAARATLGFDPKLVREGKWREALRQALEENRVASILKLSQLDFSDLTVLDIATSMGICEWLASHGEKALPLFHGVLRKLAPKVPLRIILSAGKRGEVYDQAFRAATGKSWREADKSWRQWFLAR